MTDPIELIAVDETHDGQIIARRNGDPSFTHVQDLADAMMAALALGVDLIIPAELVADLQPDQVGDLPSWIKIPPATSP